MTCLILGCPRPVHVKARQLCRGHYVKWWRYGDPTITMRLRNAAPIDRFLFSVDKTDPDGHWLWTKPLSDKGYGVFWDGTGVVAVHRWSYEHFVGPIPDGLVIDHLCRVRHCVNPEHLEPVTAAENTRRGDTTLMGANSHRAGCGCRVCTKRRREGQPSNTLAQ